jgi:hypothetical protein
LIYYNATTKKEITSNKIVRKKENNANKKKENNKNKIAKTKTRRNYSYCSTFGGTSGKSTAKLTRNRTWSNITGNTTTPLSNFDIIDKLKAVPGFHGVYSKDELAAIKPPLA